jgi:hypothetical protein
MEGSLSLCSPAWPPASASWGRLVPPCMTRMEYYGWFCFLMVLGFWSQGFVLAKQALYCLSHASSFGMWCSVDEPWKYFAQGVSPPTAWFHFYEVSGTGESMGQEGE